MQQSESEQVGFLVPLFNRVGKELLKKIGIVMLHKI